MYSAVRQRCSAFVLGHCTLVWNANLSRCNQSDTSLLYSAELGLLALNRSAVHWCCVEADLYETEVFLGVTAMTQDCCTPVLASSNEQLGTHPALSSCSALV